MEAQALQSYRDQRLDSKNYCSNNKPDTKTFFQIQKSIRLTKSFSDFIKISFFFQLLIENNFEIIFVNRLIGFRFLTQVTPSKKKLNNRLKRVLQQKPSIDST